MKKPPGEPGGFVGMCGDDAVRRDQQHEFIMHAAGDLSVGRHAVLLADIRLARPGRAA